MTTTIRVELVLSVDVSDGWADNCTMQQIYKEGVDAAVAKIQRAMREPNGIRIVSVKAVEMTTKVS